MRCSVVWRCAWILMTSECREKWSCLTIDTESRQPQIQPLKTLQEVLSWKASNEASVCAQNTVTSNFERLSTTRTKPYTLVCHDFKGGYLEDRYLQGGEKKDAYYFCRWECVDIFVYFSHHFVTVPPVGWTQAAHKHGTMMLGTIITEWHSGAALWSKVLACNDTVHQLVSQLVDICHHHGFDGWLINVENKIEASQVCELQRFVELLTKSCHTRLPGSKVLWYDSVTRTGELMWQNQLNEENSQYFDACDGIFLNYCWTPEKLAASRDIAVQKSRPFDVFVGIDVFGRGCPGGGGFNTREALEHARKYNLSSAIFAPGWVLEHLGAADFDDNDCRFWAKLHDLCQSSSHSALPLSSAFCQGHGNTFFCMGQDMTGRPWYNISLQQRQPERCWVFSSQDPSSMPSRPSLSTCLSSAYFGGCSVELSAHLTRPLQTSSFRLFSIRAKLNQILYCSFTYKENSDIPCDIYLVLTCGSGLLTRRALMGSTDDAVAHLQEKMPVFEESNGEPLAKKTMRESEDLLVRALSEKDLEQHKDCLWFQDLQLRDGGAGQQAEMSWKTRHFKIDTAKLTCSSSPSEEESVTVSVYLTSPPVSGQSRPVLSQKNTSGELHQDVCRASILVGHLQVFREQDLKLETPTVTGIRLTKLDLNNLIPSASDAKNTEIGSTTSMLSAPYVVQWEVEGSTAVDYFNVYLTKEGSLNLVGSTAYTLFVMPVIDQYIDKGRMTVTVQPVLSATALPLVMSRCATLSVFLPSANPVS